MRTVLRYPGSKWNIASKLVELIPEHHSYVEPFFGRGVSGCKLSIPYCWRADTEYDDIDRTDRTAPVCIGD